MIYAVMYDMGSEYVYYVYNLLDSIWSTEEAANDRCLDLMIVHPEDRDSDANNFRVVPIQIDTLPEFHLKK